MKALTVKNPWAWAIIHGGKDIENRSQPTKYRGLLYIHAGLTYAPEAHDFEPLPRAWNEVAASLPIQRGVMGPLRKNSLFLDPGMLIGTVDLIGCHADSECASDNSARGKCSEWAMGGYYHWMLANPKPLDCPLPAKGKLGIWNFEATV